MHALIFWTACVLLLIRGHMEPSLFSAVRLSREPVPRIFKSYNAFSSINYPDIAVIHDDRIVFYIDDKEQSTKRLRFYHAMDDRIFLLKLIPSIDPLVLENLADSYDGLILESFGVGGLPDYGNHDFAAMIEKWTSAGNWSRCPRR